MIALETGRSGKAKIGVSPREERRWGIIQGRLKSDRYEEATLWWELPGYAEKWVDADRLDAPLLALLFPAMMHGENIYLNGTVSKRLLFNVRNYTIPLLLDFFHELKNIDINASSEEEVHHVGHGIGTALSCGVDSLATLYDRYVLEGDPAHKVNTLLFMNVGSNGDWGGVGGGLAGNGDFARFKFKKRLVELNKAAAVIGIPLTPVDSNLHFFNYWGHEYTHTLKAAATVTLMQKHFCKYYYSSAGLDFKGILEFQKRYRGRDIGAWCDPILLPQISTESVEMVSDGCAYTRFEKLQRISHWKLSQAYLNVCTEHTEQWFNCSQCEKCMRTMCCIDIMGMRIQYKDIFDWSLFDKQKGTYFDQCVINADNDPFAADILRAALERNYLTPTLLTAYTRTFARLPERAMRKIRRMISEP